MTFRPGTVLFLLALAEAGCSRAPQRAETSATPHPCPPTSGRSRPWPRPERPMPPGATRSSPVAAWP